MKAFRKATEHRSAFVDFLDETQRLVDVLCLGEGSVAEERRLLHTLKGNTAIFGLTGFSTMCHELEDLTRQAERRLSIEDCGRLDESWSALAGELRVFAGEGDRGVVRLDRRMVEQHLSRVLAGTSYDQLARDIRLWGYEPASARLQTLAASARGLAARLGKTAEVVVIDNNLRIDAAPLRELWSSLVHVLRNAVDHGIEASGTLTLAVGEEADQLAIEIADDGRGIDWEALRAKAQRTGVPHGTPEDLVEALFADGVSTRDVVTETSGRGVGLAAVREAVARLDGRVEVLTAPGQGARFRFLVPSRRVSYGRIGEARVATPHRQGRNHTPVGNC